MKNIYAIFLLLLISGQSHAGLISTFSVSGSGTYNNDANLIIDGTIPGENTGWTLSTNVWWYGTNPIFTLDFGELFNVEDVLVSVDNNDYYSIQWSSDNLLWNSLFSIRSYDGEIGWGMDTLSTDANHGEYVATLNFSTVQARYMRIFATGGDNAYSIGEFQVFGTQVREVPEPSTLAIFALAIMGMGFRNLKK